MLRSTTSFTLLKRFLVVVFCGYWTGIIGNLSDAHFLDEDFENDLTSINLWMNDSSADTNKDYQIKWTVVEDDGSAPLNPKNDGTDGDVNHYLIVSGNPDGDFGGVAVLTSPVFTSYPGDTININYWIRSRWNQFNNIQIFWSNMDEDEGYNEQLLLELFPNSVPGNFLWETAAVEIPIEIPTGIKLVFYGMCGNDALDAIAIDNISITNDNDKPKTTASSTIETPSTTQSPSSSTTTQRPVANLCPSGENFLPNCNCLPSTLLLRCIQISNLTTVQDAFHRPNNLTGSDSQIDYDNLLLDFSPDEKNVIIPADFLGRIRFRTINIQCPSNDQTFRLMVHPDAFRSSDKYTTTLNILGYCDVTDFDFNFLRALEPALNSFGVTSSFNIHKADWRQSFPSLSKLSTLRLFNNTGADEWTEFPEDFEKLKLTDVFYHSNGVKDEGMSRFLDWLQEHSSDHLKNLEIQRNLLTKIPEQIGSFKKLKSLSMQEQTNRSIPIITRNSLEFSVPVAALNINSCGVTTVEPGAFLGDYFSSASINLSNNSLTRFEESAFRPVLQQMATSTGLINIYQNPFNCADDPCHLSWLLKDNRNLLSAIRNGTCASGISFAALDPAIFDSCDSN